MILLSANDNSSISCIAVGIQLIRYCKLIFFPFAVPGFFSSSRNGSTFCIRLNRVSVPKCTRFFFFFCSQIYTIILFVGITEQYEQRDFSITSRRILNEFNYCFVSFNDIIWNRLIFIFTFVPPHHIP